MGLVNLARAAATPAFRGRPPSAPDVVLSGTAHAGPRRLHAYAQVCGFPPSPVMPPTYPHVLAFDLVMRLMTRRDFPFTAPGLVHIRNTITVHLPIDADETLTFRVQAGDMAAHTKGRTVDVVTSASANGIECWTERSTYLHPERTQRPPADPPQGPNASAHRLDSPSYAEEAQPADPLPAIATWDLAGTLGRHYAGVSGDWNPIHLSPWSARLFGFRRPIAHGMWTLGRTLAAMQPLPESFTADATFVSPLALPSTVELATDDDRFCVRPATDQHARPHLTGNIASQ